MKIDQLSPAFTLADEETVAKTRDWYVEYLGAKATFDCGWYLNLSLAGGDNTIQFMSPTEPQHQVSSSAGLIYNFKVTNVDGVHRKLVGAGLEVVVPLEDHPWGDRGFAVTDPNGIGLYFYSDREPDEDWLKFSH